MDTFTLGARLSAIAPRELQTSDRDRLSALPNELLAEMVNNLPIKTLVSLRRTNKHLLAIVNSIAKKVKQRQVLRLQQAAQPANYAGLSILEALRMYIKQNGSLAPDEYESHARRLGHRYVTQRAEHMYDGKDLPLAPVLVEALLCWSDMVHHPARFQQAKTNWIRDLCVSFYPCHECFAPFIYCGHPESGFRMEDWLAMLMDVTAHPLDPSPAIAAMEAERDRREDDFWRACDLSAFWTGDRDRCKRSRRCFLRELGGPLPGSGMRYLPSETARRLMKWTLAQARGKNGGVHLMFRGTRKDPLYQAALMEELELVHLLGRQDRVMGRSTVPRWKILRRIRTSKSV